jgi:predicted Zn-dependent protease with MMP-like domain
LEDPFRIYRCHTILSGAAVCWAGLDSGKAIASSKNKVVEPRPIPAGGRQGNDKMLGSEDFTQARFERLAQETWDGLPKDFRDIVGNLVIQVTDFADRDTLNHLRIGSRYGLLGLYHGVGLPFKSVLDVRYGPDMIFLYRLPILRFAEADGESVDSVIRHVLIHEIGHHFGFSDDDMEAIEAQ